MLPSFFRSHLSLSLLVLPSLEGAMAVVMLSVRSQARLGASYQLSCFRLMEYSNQIFRPQRLASYLGSVTSRSNAFTVIDLRSLAQRPSIRCELYALIAYSARLSPTPQWLILSGLPSGLHRSYCNCLMAVSKVHQS